MTRCNRARKPDSPFSRFKIVCTMEFQRRRRIDSFTRFAGTHPKILLKRSEGIVSKSLIFIFLCLKDSLCIMQTNMLLLLLIAPLVITQRFEWHPNGDGVYPANIVDERIFNELNVGTHLTIVFLNPTKRTAGGDFKIWFTKPMNIDYVTLTVTNS